MIYRKEHNDIYRRTQTLINVLGSPHVVATVAGAGGESVTVIVYVVDIVVDVVIVAVVLMVGIVISKNSWLVGIVTSVAAD